jgi:hypothetical protein
VEPGGRASLARRVTPPSIDTFNLAVVVVVDAMEDIQGDKIGEFNHVLKRQEREGNVNNVNQQIRTSEVHVSSNKRILVELRVMNSSDEITTTQFTAQTYSSRTGFTIPREVIRELSLQPGHSLKFILFEVFKKDAQTNFVISDNDEILDRAPANNGGEEKVDTRLFSESARKYLDEHGGEARLRFRNIRTGEESVTLSHTRYTSDTNPIYFSKKARKQTGTQIGDLIEIEAVDQSSIEPSALSTDEKLDEIHTMLSDLCEVMLPSNE